MEVVYSNKWTINTGQYENKTPMFSEKVILPDGTSDKIVQKTYDGMIKRVEGRLVEAEEAIKGVKPIEKVAEATEAEADTKPKYVEIDGKKYPRVTSILGQMFDMDSIKNKKAYADEGTRVHEEIERQLTAGEYKTIKREGLTDFKEYKWETTYEQFQKESGGGFELEKKVLRKSPMYTGTADAVTEDAVWDWKTGDIRRSHLMQVAAYAKALKKKKAFVASLKTGEVRELYEKEIDTYYEQFLVAHKIYTTRYKK